MDGSEKIVRSESMKPFRVDEEEGAIPIELAMPNKPETVEQYLSQLPKDRRQALEAIRQVILKNLPKGYEEGIQYGMIGYYVPHRLYPAGYHCDPKQPLPFAHLASQKNHMAVYLMCIYGREEHVAWFQQAWAKTGKKLDMGKSCIRFKKIEDVALPVIGQAIKRVPVRKYIEHYELALRSGGKRAANAKAKVAGKKKAGGSKASTKKAKAKSTKKSISKKGIAKKTPLKKTPLKKTPAKKSSTRAASSKKKPTKKAATRKKVATRKATGTQPAPKTAVKKKSTGSRQARANTLATRVGRRRPAIKGARKAP